MAMDPLPAAVDAHHLTEALRRAGAIGDASVRDVVVESSRTTILSRIIRLRLAYDGDADDAPRGLVLKTCHPQRAASNWASGEREVAFFRDVAAAMTVQVVPRCFEAHFDAATKDWHLLLEDLTDTHVIATVWPLPPTMAQCACIVDVLARFHATWWDEARLGQTIGTWRNEDTTRTLVRTLQGHFETLAQRLGDALSPDRRTLYQRMLDAAPQLLRRHDAHRNLTVLHGDAHVWNCFLPRDGGGDARLFDWDAWRLGVAASDLAYMMAQQWYPERRQAMEPRLLDRYHATLLAHGVRHYSRAALDEDYRWAVLWQMTLPLWQMAYGVPPIIWWNNMERILLAVDDWGCRALLG